MAKRFRFVPVWKKNPERTAGTRPLHVSLAHPNLSATKTFPDAQNFNNIFPGTLGTLCDVFISEVAAVMVGTFEDLNCWSGFLTLNADTFAIKHWQLQFGDCFGFVVETWFSLANVSVCVCVCVYMCAYVCGACWLNAYLAAVRSFSMQFLLSGFCLCASLPTSLGHGSVCSLARGVDCHEARWIWWWWWW